MDIVWIWRKKKILDKTGKMRGGLTGKKKNIYLKGGYIFSFFFFFCRK